ncbi:MAG: metal-dependent hydrolase [Methylobacter sp.]
MDTVTHAIIGAVTARACTKIKNDKARDRSLLFIAALAAAFPDSDYLLFWVNPYRFITEWHRGLTHSLIMLPAWAALLSAVAFFVMKKQVPFRIVFGYCSLGLLTHIIADLITLYGVEIFAPFSDRRFALSLAFDMDPWIGLLALLGLVFGLKNRRNAVFGLIAIGTYIGLMFYFQQSALAVIDARTNTSHGSFNKVYALPQPFIPFHWKLVIDRHVYYETADLSLFSKATRLMNELLSHINYRMSVFSTLKPYEKEHKHFIKTRNHIPVINIDDFRSMNQLQWRNLSKHGDTLEIDQALEVWQHDSFSKFRKFSSIPILYRVDTDPGSTCIWYTDIRYVFPLMKPPFRYGMCRQHSNNYWQLYRLRRNTENIRQMIEP